LAAAEKWVAVRVLEEQDEVTSREAGKSQTGPRGPRPDQVPSRSYTRPVVVADSRGRKYNVPDSWRRYADLFDSGEEYRVLVEIPGVSREELEVSMTNRNLWIQAATRQCSIGEEGTFVLSRGAGTKVLRRVNFPEEVMSEKTKASLNNGVLEVRAPKKTPTTASRHRTLLR
jgi:HSP20 family molecular chaperone IbpA